MLRYERRQRSSGWLIGQARERAGLARDVGPESGGWVEPVRPARCRWRIAEQVGVHHSDGRLAHWSGIERCASIWACPVCSAVIRHGRALEIQAAADRWAEQGGAVVMASATTRHYLGDELSANLDAAMAGWRWMVKTRAWRVFRARYGVEGYVRAVEVTWGSVNGWHPHIHALLFLRVAVPAALLDVIEGEVYALWSAAVERQGGRSVNRAHGVRLSRGGSADYVAKVQEHDRGAGLEMARLDLKRGRAGSVMPFELLDSAEGRSLWLEYVEATHGRRAITWSRGLRELVGVEEEQTDEELLAETETADLVALLDAATYDAIRSDAGALAGVLELAESGGGRGGEQVGGGRGGRAARTPARAQPADGSTGALAPVADRLIDEPTDHGGPDEQPST